MISVWQPRLFDNTTALASDTSLLKRGKMTEAISAVAPMPAPSERPRLPCCFNGAEIGRTYRERFDGQGYPNRMKGAAIPQAGAHRRNCLKLRRPDSGGQFKQAWPFEKAVDYIRACAKPFRPGADRGIWSRSG